MSATTTQAVEQSLYRDAIGRFASGVTVVTTATGGQDFGTTASAVSSLSMEPPMLLVCLNRTSETQRAILTSRRFAVNILGEDQAAIATRFATKSPTKFEGTDIVRGSGGAPLIAGALAQLECSVAETVTGGTHTVFLGVVEHAAATDGTPLAYYRGQFGRFEHELQEAAYRDLRALVLDRSLPVGEPLDLEELASRLDLEAPHVLYGLTKLATDGLVAREPDGRFVVEPLTADAAVRAIEARCSVEVAVADHVARSGLDPADAERLRADADEAARGLDAGDLERCMAAGQSFHGRWVALTGNDLLVDFYDRLGIQAIWARAVSTSDLAVSREITEYLPALVDACAAGDCDAAKRLLYAHAETVGSIVRRAIEAEGGVL